MPIMLVIYWHVILWGMWGLEWPMRYSNLLTDKSS